MFPRLSRSRHPLSKAEKWSAWTTGFAVATVGGWAYLNATPEVTLPPVPKPPTPNEFDLYRTADKAVVRWPDSVDEYLDGSRSRRTAAEKARSYSTARREKWLQANTTALNLFRQAQQLPCRYPAKDWSDMGSFTSEYLWTRQLKIVERKVRLSHGDVLGAANSVLDLLERRVDESRGNAWFGQGIVRAELAETCAAIPALLSQMNESETKQILARFEKIAAKRDDVHQVVSNLHNYVLGFVLPSMRGEDQPRIKYEGSWREILIDGNLEIEPITTHQKIALYFVSKRAYLAKVEKLFAAANLEANHPYKGMSNLPAKVFYLSTARYMLSGTLYTEAVIRVHLNLMRTEIALHRHLLLKGHYPKNLNELVPRLPAKALIDPFSKNEALLRYRWVGKGYRVYSVGPDQKDDVGNKIFGERWGEGGALPTDFKGDFALRVKSPTLSQPN